MSDIYERHTAYCNKHYPQIEEIYNELEHGRKNAANRQERAYRRREPSCFSHEDQEAIKMFLKQYEFWPTVWETERAKKVFQEKLTALFEDVCSGRMTKAGAINLAVIEVWVEAKRFQNAKDKKEQPNLD